MKDILMPIGVGMLGIIAMVLIACAFGVAFALPLKLFWWIITL